MKKIISSLFAIIAVVMLASCGNDNTPTGITKTYMDALVAKDLDKAFDCMVNSNGEDLTKEQREMFKNVILSKINDPEKKNGWYESYEIIKEEIDAKDENKAKVTVKEKDGEGKEKETTVDCVKVDGDWKVKTNK